jgi:hypothetical protein
MQLPVTFEITSHGFAFWVLGWYGFFHEADGLAVAPGLHVRRGFTAPPHVICEAPRPVLLVGGHLDQAVAAFLFSRRPGRD